MHILGIGSPVLLVDGQAGHVTAFLTRRDRIGNLMTPLVQITLADGTTEVVHGTVFELLLS